jgi:hypothetical protein
MDKRPGMLIDINIQLVSFDPDMQVFFSSVPGGD